MIPAIITTTLGLTLGLWAIAMLYAYSVARAEDWLYGHRVSHRHCERFRAAQMKWKRVERGRR